MALKEKGATQPSLGSPFKLSVLGIEFVELFLLFLLQFWVAKPSPA